MYTERFEICFSVCFGSYLHHIPADSLNTYFAVSMTLVWFSIPCKMSFVYTRHTWSGLYSWTGKQVNNARFGLTVPHKPVAIQF